MEVDTNADYLDTLIWVVLYFIRNSEGESSLVLHKGFDGVIENFRATYNTCRGSYYNFPLISNNQSIESIMIFTKLNNDE